MASASSIPSIEAPLASTPGSADTPDLATLSTKYAAEKEKRQRSDGQSQYEELAQSDRLSSLAQDHFVDHEALNQLPSPLQDGQEVQVIMLGAGFGALLFAARLIEAGISPEVIRLVDVAGGFGGTWYWNRYPGLMCDTEASVYMPLLEEMGYMPKHKYAYGDELRDYSELVARHYGFADKGVFRTTIQHAEWNDDTRRWKLNMVQDRGPGQKPLNMTVHSQFFCYCAGVLNNPKAPKIPGLEAFQGPMFHTARWDYNISGGSQTDPTLTEFRGKRVGIIGTGATAVQAVPKLADAAGELFVFQRTPSSVSTRGQQATDPTEWRTKVATQPGWQRERSRNFELLTQGEKGDSTAFTDGWTRLYTNTVLAGNSDAPVMEYKDVPTHIGRLLALDAPLQEEVRRRVDEIVQDRRTAEILTPWYPTWCKRACFHDDYLQAFNRPNVHVIDTSDSKGALRATSTGLAVGEQGSETPLDVLILATGFRSPGSAGDPGKKANMTIVGRDGLSMEQKWATKGAGSMHGVVSASFPNFFMSNYMHVATNPDFTGALDTQARHVAYMISESLRRTAQPDRLSIEVSEAAEEAWVEECIKYSLWASPAAMCTPGYYNAEGEALQTEGSPEEQRRRRRSTPYSKGLPVFRHVLDAWKADGNMEGIVLRS